jgi:hypothetical protein
MGVLDSVLRRTDYAQVKQHTRRLVLFLLIAFAIHARADLLEHYSVYSLIGNPPGRESRVTREQLLKTPVWRVQDDSPPLSPRRADVLATARFQKLVKDVTRSKDTKYFMRDSISLVDMGDNLHWVYVVSFMWTGAISGPAPQVRIMVLMDGTVIEPKVATGEWSVACPAWEAGYKRAKRRTEL